MMAKQRRATFTAQLQAAINASAMTKYRISKETGISQSTLSLFCTGKRGLSLHAIDLLVALLDLELKPQAPRNHKEK